MFSAYQKYDVHRQEHQLLAHFRIAKGGLDFGNKVFALQQHSIACKKFFDFLSLRLTGQ
jgi:hypothetical protein